VILYSDVCASEGQIRWLKLLLSKVFSVLTRLNTAIAYYQLLFLALTLRKQGSRYQFQWDNSVVKNAQIQPDSLRATASIKEGKLVYLPVLLSPTAGQYDIILNSDRRAKITHLKIVQNNQIIYSTSRKNWQPKGEIFFSWNGKTTQGKPAPQGLYQLKIEAQLEQDDAPPELANINITFAHDPQWLK
ncbi:MAG: FlgD immunoglobulin-like domain containing protein, partial [Cyanobacteriota bacterium]